MTGRKQVQRAFLEKQLAMLAKVKGVQEAIFFSEDGFELAAYGADSDAAARLAAISSSLAALGSAIAEETKIKDFSRTIIESNGGLIVLMRVDAKKSMSLAVVAGKDAVLGQLLWATKACCQAARKAVVE